MKVRNCIIVTEDNSWIEIMPDEIDNFTGNRIFNRYRLPAAVFDLLKLAVDSGEVNATAADLCRMTVQKELIR
jgi:hypothetical protein